MTCGCEIAVKGYILLVSNPGKEEGWGHVQAMGATAEPVNLLLLLEDQEMNRSNEREPN